MALIDDYAQAVTAYKDLESFAVSKMDAEEKAKYLERRVVDSEGALAKITMETAKQTLLTKFPAVEAEDLAEATTVSGAEKLAARIQAKADKVAADVQAKIDKALEGGLSKEVWEQVKKATGRPREIQDTTQNLTADAEQKGELGKQLESQEKIEFGTVKGLETASKWAAGHALDRM